MTKEQIEQSEEAVKKKAAKIAYQYSENALNSELQTYLFKLCKDCIVLGARLFQEELFKIEKDEKQSK